MLRPDQKQGLMNCLGIKTVNVIELAQKLIQFDTITPKGSECLDFIQDYLSNLGFEVTRLPFSDVDNLFARKGLNSPHLMYVGHVDVVPTGSGWKYPPFAGIVDDGFLYGRGTVDMKGSIAAFLAALTKVEINGSISVLLTSDEEGPAKNGVIKVIPWLQETNNVPTYALVGEPTAVTEVGDTIKNGRRGSISFDISVYGKQGHVAYPQLADNAATPLIELLYELKTTLDDGTPDFQPSNLEVVKLSMPNKVYNVISGEAYAAINIRFNTLHSFESLTERVQLAMQKVHEKYQSICFLITPLPSAEPFISSSADWALMVSQAVSSVTGILPNCSTSGGTSDARFIQKICPVVELGLCNKTAHHVDEHANVADIEILQKIYENLIQNNLTAFLRT